MKEISLHIIDIFENSIKGGASLVKLTVKEDVENNWLTLKITDNGKGIPKDMLGKVRDPFVTSRTTRTVGLGISLLEAAAERCGGKLQILSKVGLGTSVISTFQYDHIDRAPLGNMTDTIITIVMMLGESNNFIYKHRYNDKEFIFDTREIRETLGGNVPLNNLEVIGWMRGYISEGESEIYTDQIND
ncbi:MAG: sensor histidine kinase [Eubacteriaceae bacterium]|nr:sensor histidine kinase [Eubacteriaceae bacterium]